MKKLLLISGIILFSAVAIFTGSCKKESKDDTSTTPTSTTVAGGPTLTTAEANSVTYTTAVLGGTITSIGDCDILLHGVAYSIAHNPTITNTILTDNTITGTGSFSVTATGLLPATTYYARAFATNCKGTNYGNEIHFTTLGTGGGGGGGGGTLDSSYNLTVSIDGGTPYVCADPHSDSIIGPDGKRMVSFGFAVNRFTLVGWSFNINDNSASNGFQFSIETPLITGVGTFTFTDVTTESQVGWMQRFAPGLLIPDGSNNNLYNNGGNFERHFNGPNCEETDLPVATQTVTITQWAANIGDIIIGSFSGTFYENSRTGANCQSSEVHTYSGHFKVTRLS